MAEQEPTFIVLRHPTQCMLWENPDRASAKFSEIFDVIECYETSRDLDRTLYKCKECGQLYFYECFEWDDWVKGIDKRYTTLFPVQTQEEIDAMKRASPFTLLRYYPRLHLDGKPSWNGKHLGKTSET